MNHSSSLFHRMALASKIIISLIKTPAVQEFFISLDLPQLEQKYQVYQRSTGRRVE